MVIKHSIFIKLAFLLFFGKVQWLRPVKKYSFNLKTCCVLIC